MGMSERLDDVLVDQELETVTCTSIREAPTDRLNFKQADKFLNLSRETIFYGELVRLLDRSRFMGVVSNKFCRTLHELFLQPQYLKIPRSAPAYIIMQYLIC